jgi:hypothetical protein
MREGHHAELGVHGRRAREDARIAHIEVVVPIDTKLRIDHIAIGPVAAALGAEGVAALGMGYSSSSPFFAN